MGVREVQRLSGDRLVSTCFLGAMHRTVFFEKLGVQIDFVFTDQDPTSPDDHPDDDPKANEICVLIP